MAMACRLGLAANASALHLQLHGLQLHFRTVRLHTLITHNMSMSNQSMKTDCSRVAGVGQINYIN